MLVIETAGISLRYEEVGSLLVLLHQRFNIGVFLHARAQCYELGS